MSEPNCSLDPQPVAEGQTDEAIPTKSRARIRYNAALRLVRRAHLYAGLFMMPWVFLYGITAFLFNHPEAFPDRQAVAFGPEDSAGTSLEGFPRTSELASRIVAGLNASAGGSEGRPPLRLILPEAARYSRDLIATVTDRGREHSVRINLETATGTILSTAASHGSSVVWPAAGQIDLPDPPRDRLASGIPQLLAKLGSGAETVTVRNPPDAVFIAESQGKLWRVTYNLQSGVVTGRPYETSNEQLSTRRFLTGLHLARGYPSGWDARWVWALVVDGMFATMVFWGVSGLLMWWQMKSTRRWGMLVLLASAVVAITLATGMHHVLAS